MTPPTRPTSGTVIAMTFSGYSSTVVNAKLIAAAPTAAGLMNQPPFPTVYLR